MLPITTLQLSDFATFETELNGPNLLPENATEPQVGFAELLGLTVRPLPEATLPAGLELPEDGNPLPVSLPSGALPATLPLMAGTESVAATTLTGGQGRELPAALTAAMGQRTPAVALPTVTSAATTGGQPVSQPAAAPLAELAVTGASGPLAATPLATLRDTSAAEVPQATTRPVKDVSFAPTKIAMETRTPLETRGAPLPQQPLPVVPTAEARVALEPGRDMQRLRQAPPTAGPLAAAVADTAARGTELPATELPQASRPSPAVAATPLAQGQTPTPVPVTLESGEAPVAQAATTTAASLASSRPAAELPTPTGVLADRIDTPVRDATWGEQLGQRLQLMASNRLQTAEIRLSPAELGPLRVQVALEDGAANVTFHAQHAVTREAIEQALPRLREMLAENGLQLNQTDVGDQGVRQGDRQAGQEPRAAMRGQAELAADAEVDDAAIGISRQREPDGLVDTFV